MHKLLDSTGRTLYIQRPAEAAALLAYQPPRELPRRPAQALPLGYRLLLWALRLLVILAVVFLLALLFFLFGEDRSEVERPTLTVHQRAQVFRTHAN